MALSINILVWCHKLCQNIEASSQFHHCNSSKHGNRLATVLPAKSYQVISLFALLPLPSGAVHTEMVTVDLVVICPMSYSLKCE